MFPATPFVRVLAIAIAGATVLAVACSSEAPASQNATATPRPAVQPTATPIAARATPGPLNPFVLPRARGEVYSLADVIGKQPVSVVFYRGFF